MKERSRSFRKNMTPAENRIWYFLRDRRFHNYKFIREFVIGPYIADFVCREKKLVLELDGDQHAEKIIYDNRRTIFLESLGYRVMRVWNDEVFNDIDGVLEVLLDLLEHVPD